MSALVPNRFLIDLEFPLRFRPRPPRLDGSLAGWGAAELLPRLGAMDGLRDFADVWACWNDDGLYVACRVEGKKSPPKCDPKAYWHSDHLRLCTDMRDARDIRRASRYCQQFYFLPAGGLAAADRGASGGRGGVDGGTSRGRGGASRGATNSGGGAGRGASGDAAPVAGSAKFQRAKENAPAMDDRALHVASHVFPGGWQLEAHIPASVLSGFDPAEHPRIGFFTMVEDREHGQQPLTIGDDLYWYVDPSTWATAVLTK